MAEPSLMSGQGCIAASAEALLADGAFGLLEAGPVHDSAERRALKDVAAARGAGLALGAQPLILGGKLDPGSPDPAARDAALDAALLALEQARQVGAGALALVSGPEHPGPERPEALLRTGEWLALVGKAAAPLPVHLEVFDFDVDKRRLIGPTVDAVALAARIRPAAPNVGLCLDLSHLPLQHEDPSASLRLAKDVLTHVHVGNCVLKDPAHPRYGDTHPRFGIEGGENGVGELAAFLKILFEIGYLGGGIRRDVSFEVKPGPEESVADLVSHSLGVWAEAWSRLQN